MVIKNIYFFCVVFISLTATLANATQQSIDIVSLNTMMLPVPISISYQSKRAFQIAQILKDYPADVVALEEVFMNGPRKKIQSMLKDIYPYQYHLGKSSTDKMSFLSSGLLLLSKYPFKLLEGMHFKNYNKLSFDRFSSKGVIFIQLQLENNKSIQLAMTHLQANESKKNADIRLKQLAEIKQMQEKHREHDVPQVLIGDLNIDGHNPQALSDASAILPFENFPLQGKLQNTFGHKTQCFSPRGFFSKGKNSLLDHFWLTYSANEDLKYNITEEVVPFLGTIRHKSCPLSDHYAIHVNLKI